MDPVTIALLASSAVSGITLLVSLYRSRRRARQQIPPPIEEQTSSPEIQPPPSKIETHTAAKIVEAIVGRVEFCSKRVFVGNRPIDRSLGLQEIEVPFPATGVRIRPMRDMSELPALLPNELLAGEAIFLARLASDEAMVTVPTDEVEVFEETHEAVWRVQKRILYVLLDVSGSMFPDGSFEKDWRRFIWQPLILRLLEHAARNEAIFLYREFHDSVRVLHRAIGSDQVTTMREHLESVAEGNGTNIPAGIHAAIKDFEGEEYDEGEIVIVTDGENNQELDPVGLRQTLDVAKLKLHSILLGEKNEPLRAASDLSQIVKCTSIGQYTLHDAMRRSSPASQTSPSISP